MKIRKLQLKNIGVFDDETIEFKECKVKDKAEIHILTGENGTGKTTLLMALASSFYLFPAFSVDSNSFKKRFRFFEYDGSESYVFPEEDKFKSQIKVELNEDDLVKIVANPTWDSIINEVTNNEKIKHYRKISSSESKPNIPFNFAAFAYSGYRRIKDEPIEIGKEIDENPLKQALEFVKNENSKFTVNQWLGQNLLNSSLAQTKKKLDEAEQFHKKVQTLENFINNIIRKEINDDEIKFEMQSATKLVLIKSNEELDFDVLPDGLKSLISWIGDLLMRLDSLKWENDTPIFDREIILFLDEIEVHLHPSWQRKVLPIIQTLFKNAQIFVSTHSPFVVNSVDDAWVYKLKLNSKGKVKKESVKRTENSQSITQVLREVFDIYGLFGKEVQDNIDEFEKLRDKILSNGTDLEAENELLKIAKLLAKEPSDQIKNIVRGELEQLSEIKGKNFLI